MSRVLVVARVSAATSVCSHATRVRVSHLGLPLVVAVDCRPWRGRFRYGAMMMLVMVFHVTLKE
jgi:hypothetical protein